MISVVKEKYRGLGEWGFLFGWGSGKDVIFENMVFELRYKD